MLSHLCLSLGFLFFGTEAKRKHVADVEMIRVWPQWLDKDTFKRISEYFTKKENDGKRIVMRTQSSDRAGLYFLTRVRHLHTSLADAKFVLQIIMPDSPNPRPPYVFPARVGPGEHVFELGLTGKDWPGRRAHPVAWRLDLLGANGQLLAWSQSFVWEKPGLVAVPP
jgi:hypothetical protein